MEDYVLCRSQRGTSVFARLLLAQILKNLPALPHRVTQAHTRNKRKLLMLRCCSFRALETRNRDLGYVSLQVSTSTQMFLLKFLRKIKTNEKIVDEDRKARKARS